MSCAGCVPLAAQPAQTEIRTWMSSDRGEIFVIYDKVAKKGLMNLTARTYGGVERCSAVAEKVRKVVDEGANYPCRLRPVDPSTIALRCGPRLHMLVCTVCTFAHAL